MPILRVRTLGLSHESRTIILRRQHLSLNAAFG